MALSFFSSIGAPDELRARAAAGPGPEATLRINAHIHLPPNFSAFDTVAQAVDQADAQGIDLLGVSNYYDYTVYDEFARRAATKGIFPLFGLEILTRIEEMQQAGVKINDPGNPGRMYLCGKAIAHFAPLSAEASALLETIRQNDAPRMASMVARMEIRFAAAGIATGLDDASVKAGIVRRHGCPPETVYLQERHVAQAFQEALFEKVPASARKEALARLFGAAPGSAPDDAVGIQNELRSQLMKAGKPAYAEEAFVGFEHAFQLVLALGGVPCYPTLIDGANPLCAFEESPERLVDALRARGIHAAEFIPLRNAPETLARYVHALRQAGLIVTAGTEHNTRDAIPLEPTCRDGAPVPEDVAGIFREGACVLAAHQYLTARGEPGYVDSRGRLNPAYASAEERIADCARLGATVLRRCRELAGK